MEDYYQYHPMGMGLRDIGTLANCLIGIVTLILTTIILVWLMLKRNDPLWS